MARQTSGQSQKDVSVVNIDGKQKTLLLVKNLDQSLKLLFKKEIHT